MKKLKFTFFTLSLIGLIGHIPAQAQTEGVHFSVRPIFGDHQTDDKLAYFDLLMKAGETQDFKVDIVNHSAKSIKVNTSFGTAATGSTGVVDYTPNLIKPDASLKINLKDYVTMPKQVTIAPYSAVQVTAQAKMPTEKFTGVIAGGLNFEEALPEENKSEQQENGMVIKNHYRYVVGLVLRQSTTVLSPQLSLGDVGAAQVNNRNVISAHLTNSAMSYLTQMNTQASVSKEGDSSVNYQYSNAMMEMAPTSAFNLAIPVSLTAGLDGKYSKALEPGTYHLKMTVFGGENAKGPYQTQVNGKTVKYNYRWDFSKDFTITAQRAKALNAVDPTVKQPLSLLLILIIAIVIVLLLIGLFVLLLKKRRKKEQDNEDVTQN